MELTAEQLKHKRYYLENKEKVIERNKLRRAKGLRKYNPVAERKQKLKSTYGLSWDEYVSLYNKQKGLCAICFKFLDIDSKVKTQKPYVDHCHTTKEVRGLLCHKCNFGLGQFEDNTVSLQNAIKYLEQYGINK